LLNLKFNNKNLNKFVEKLSYIYNNNLNYIIKIKINNDVVLMNKNNYLEILKLFQKESYKKN